MEMQMQGSGESSVPARMAELRMVCEREIPIQQRRIDSLRTHYRHLFDSVKSDAQRTIQLQGSLGKYKAELREAEDALVKALAAGLINLVFEHLNNITGKKHRMTRKEAKLMAMMDSITVTKARVEELKRVIEVQRQRKDEYSAILSQQSEALTASKVQCIQKREHMEQIEEAISWYNGVLGFRIECGHGVKFIFTNINPENPNEEYSFVIRHENEIYTLLNCVPHLSDMKELVSNLNKSNGLFKFVRIMRQKFQEAVVRGIAVHASSVDQEFSIISVSAPATSDSTGCSRSSSNIEHETCISRLASHS